MRKSLLVLLALPPWLFACEPERQFTPKGIAKGSEAANATSGVERPNRRAMANDRYTDTRYEYADANGQPLVIENSLPKGGRTYSTPAGKTGVYVVFWTRIVNKTAVPVHSSVALPADSFQLADKPAPSVALPPTASVSAGKRPAKPDNYFKIVFPSEEMTEAKVPLFNYGLKEVNTVLDDKLRHPSSLQLTVQPKATRLMYVVILASRGRNGTVRAGFSVQGDKLYYRVNDEEIYCGHSNTKHLTPQP